MRLRITAAIGGLALVGTLVAALPHTVGAAPPPEHTLSVSGTGVTTYPAFDPDVERYAVTGGADGKLRVRASTSDPGGQVLVDGVPRGAKADVVVTGAPGEEVSVIFDDAGGRTAHSYFLAPDGFPTLEAETTPGTELTPGLVLLTLSDFNDKVPTTYYETAVDRNGVPVHVRAEAAMSLDLKKQPDGSLTVQRRSAGGVWAGAPLVTLDAQWQPTGEVRRTDGLVNTDPHDSIRYPDGRTILLSYEYQTHEDGSRWMDAIAQEIDADGNEIFTWDSQEHVDIATESMMPKDHDYAHVNSVVVMEDGHWLLSFRHLSAVFKVARFDDGEHQAGEVIWRLGGRKSDFAFPDDEHAGPCAQHTASELPNGNILIFDNGGGDLGASAPSLCVNPEAPGDPERRINRVFTRITEYALDEQTMTATLVSPYGSDDPDDADHRFAYFAGGVAQLENGHRLIGWASSQEEIATELDTDGETELWHLRDTNPDVGQRLFTYRAHLAEVEDEIDPTVTITDPGEVPQGANVHLDRQCRDRGGSGLDTCTVTDGGRLDTSELGEHTVTVTATDAAGNSVSRDATYVVVPAEHAVDAAVRVAGTKWKGVGVVGKAKKQQVTTKVNQKKRKRAAKVRITNRGNAPDRFLITGKGSTRLVKVVHRSGGRKISGKVTGSGFRTPKLAPGASLKVKIVFKRQRPAKRNQRFPVRVQSASDGAARDAVRVRVKVRR